MPTLLFIDPHTQEVLNRVVGYVEPTKLIEEGKKALNPHLNLKGCSLRYQTDKQNTEAAMTYLNSLKVASTHQPKRQHPARIPLPSTR